MFYGTLKKGFGMVEILIYITILGILAGIVVPNIFSYLAKAKYSATEQTLRVTKQVITSYYTDVNSFPQTLQDLQRRPQDAPKWFGPYFEGKDEDYIPQDGWGNDVHYRLLDPRSSKPYELYSYGQNGEAGDDSERIYAS